MERVRVALILVALAVGCGPANGRANPTETADPHVEARERMVRDQIEARGVEDPRVLAAMRKIPRHELVPERNRPLAYADRPLPIGLGQTISQPYIVAYMTERLHLDGSEKVLEIGTGSGYQAAVLGELAAEVYTIEIIPELARRSARDLERLGYENVHVREGDGYRGWPGQAPFDAVIVTAAPASVPPALVDQLALGGRMVLPVGDSYQELVLITRSEEGVERRELIPVRFVPMTGEARKADD